MVNPRLRGRASEIGETIACSNWGGNRYYYKPASQGRTHPSAPETGVFWRSSQRLDVDRNQNASGCKTLCKVDSRGAGACTIGVEWRRGDSV
jgi:hypothetical protein